MTTEALPPSSFVLRRASIAPMLRLCRADLHIMAISFRLPGGCAARSALGSDARAVGAAHRGPSRRSPARVWLRIEPAPALVVLEWFWDKLLSLGPSDARPCPAAFSPLRR